MNQEKAYYRAIAVGIAIGVLTTSFFFVGGVPQSVAG